MAQKMQTGRPMQPVFLAAMTQKTVARITIVDHVARRMDSALSVRGRNLVKKNGIALAGKVVYIYLIIASIFFCHLRKQEEIREFLASRIANSSMQEIVQYLQENGGALRRSSRDTSAISFPFPNRGMTVIITKKDKEIRASILLPDSEDEIIPGAPTDDGDDRIDFCRIAFASMIYTAPFMLTSAYFVYCANKKKPFPLFTAAEFG